MKKFVVFIKQKGEGCDYTIGCARNLLTIKANDIEEAEGKLSDIIKEEYRGETELSSCVIYEVANESKVDLKQIYSDIKKEKELSKQKRQEEKERQEYERLVKKFGDFKK